MIAKANLFRNIPNSDIMHFYGTNGALDGKRVVDSLKYKLSDVSIATKVPPNSIRYDDRIPFTLKQRLEDWATAINLVASFFHDDQKTVLWFQTPNPELGNMKPKDMILMGRFPKLLNFIQTALEENLA